ncbi:hypothetical protein BDV34DRAFT_226306 [Aspergillus parasiticus]|uniref:Major facilitator superfamily (MFS) profile domain-containing protein n=1 Tax=Aspergillus parasiticus TaxID=5067 RepID=A0A5N6DH93_ASPPA|nr:hypothetical protein BDV34DRAFT_226306 [Aspergillus parasiticus]
MGRSGSMEEGISEQRLDNVSDEVARIENPLKGISKNDLKAQVRAFVNEHGLTEDTDVFVKGALLAQKPSEYEAISELDEEDRVALRDEIVRKWHQPKALWFTIIVCSIGAAVQGWDQTGSNGANLSFPKAFGIGSNSDHDQWIVGLINAAPTIAQAFIGCTVSDPINNLVGRRGAIFIAGIFAFSSCLGSALTQNWPQLFVCRILLGIGMGIKASTTSVYAAENAPARIRGTLTMTWQLYVAFGIFLGFSANLAVVNTGDIAWRLQLGSAFIPAVPLLLSVLFCPESPRWYIKKGRYGDAYASLCKLRFTKVQAARDLYTMHVQYCQEQESLKSSEPTWKRFGQLFTIPRVRRANLAAGTVMLSQQMCGINIISFYSSSVFTDAGVSERQALWASWGFGVTTFVFAIPALRTIDTFGRRSLLLATFPHMAWTLLAAGLCFLIPGDGSSRLPAIALFIFLFAAVYAPGEGPVCYPYAAEVFPLSHRELGMSWAVFINALGSAVLSLTFPWMKKALTPTGAFGFYCGLNVIAFVMIFLWVPETKELTLEELDYVFDISTVKFIKYQIKEGIPYFWKRWVLWQRGIKLRPLYDFSETRVVPEFRMGDTTQAKEDKLAT